MNINPSPSSASPQPFPRIAIVEDEADQRDSLEEYLTLLGYPTWAEASAEAFYRRVMLTPVDMVVLDMGLPGEDGLALAEHVSQTGMGIIIVSARGELNDRLAGIKAGADTYLVKPVELRELAANLEALWRRLSRGSGEQEAPASTWHLLRNRRELRTPNGTSVRLTPSEFTLISCLINSGGEAPRQSVCEALGTRLEEGNFHRIDVMLSRLRKKVLQSTGLSLPLATAPLQRLELTDPITGA